MLTKLFFKNKFQLSRRIPSIMKLSLLLLIVYIVHLAQSEIIINDTIRAFRQDYRKFQKNSFKIVDRSFFKVYNALNSSLFVVLEPLYNISSLWKKLCDGFKDFKLSNETKIRINEICYDVHILIDKLLFERDESLTMFFYGDLTAITPAGMVLEKLFFHMELQMEEMWVIYARNSSCVAPFIKSYIPSFEILVDNICFMSNQTISKLKPEFSEARQLLLRAKDLLMKCLDTADYCLTTNKPQKCVESFVC